MAQTNETQAQRNKRLHQEVEERPFDDEVEPPAKRRRIYQMVVRVSKRRREETTEPEDKETTEPPAKRRRVDSNEEETKEPPAEEEEASNGFKTCASEVLFAEEEAMLELRAKQVEVQLRHDRITASVNELLDDLALAIRKSVPGPWLERLAQVLELPIPFLWLSVREKFGYHIPTADSLAKMREFFGNRRVLSIGAGRGFVERLLGLEVTCTDAMLTHGANALDFKFKTFMDVVKCDAEEAMKKFKDHDGLLLCWPSNNDPMAFEALSAFAERNNPNARVVYIGEGKWGCTANDAFFELLENKFEQVFEIEGVSMSSDLHDSVQGYKLKPVKPAWGVPAINWNSSAFNTFRE
jgi:hypothetical protein